MWLYHLAFLIYMNLLACGTLVCSQYKVNPNCGRRFSQGLAPTPDGHYLAAGLGTETPIVGATGLRLSVRPYGVALSSLHALRSDAFYAPKIIASIQGVRSTARNPNFGRRLSQGLDPTPDGPYLAVHLGTEAPIVGATGLRQRSSVGRAAHS